MKENKKDDQKVEQALKSDGNDSQLVVDPLYTVLGKNDITYIAGKGVINIYDKHTILMREGEVSDYMFIIISGRVRVYANNNEGKEVVLNIQDAGEYFGEIALIDEAPRSATVETLQKSVLSKITREVFEQCLEERPEIAGSFLSALTQRIRYLTHSVKNLALNDVHGRLIYTLDKLAEDQDGERVVKIALTHKDISHMVGSSREMVSKLMKSLQDNGLIECKNRRIILRKLPSHDLI